MEQTTILNMGLHHLGMEPINDITDLNPSAKVLNDYWVPARDDTFSEHQWPFADAQIQLQLVSATVVGWDYVYGYPVKVAGVWKVYSEGAVDHKDECPFETKYLIDEDRRVICSNEPLAMADVTYVVENVSVWSPKFCMAFSIKMALLACPDLVSDTEKSLYLNQLFTGAINEAKRVGFSEQRNKPNQNSQDGTVNSRG